MSTAGYSKGNCAHCHEQHTSVNGAEPAPSTGPIDTLIFDTSNTNQSTNFCFDCHGTGAPVYQDGGFVTNRSYSYRAGAWTADTLSDVETAFSQTSSHNLADVLAYAAAQAWNFSPISNACSVCHDPHLVQGDPANAPNSAKSSGSRGWMVTRPSQHPTTNLWGDGAGEKMSDYSASYQAPLTFGSPYPAGATYEPDGSGTTTGTNLADINTFCLDCHANEVPSTGTVSANPATTAGKLTAINWNTDKHGKGNADNSLCGNNPYPSGAAGLGKVLSCLDCHEPHGSANVYLIRGEVNGAVPAGAIGSLATTNWSFLCDRCHQDDLEISGSCQADHYYITHHDNATGCSNEQAYAPAACGACHSSGINTGCGSSRVQLICTNCHYHGSTAAGMVTF